MNPVDNLKARVDELADLMEKFQLSQAELSGQEWRVSFKKRSAQRVMQMPEGGFMAPHDSEDHEETHSEPAVATPAVPQGTPVNSPMNGIYYTASSPSAPPFVKE